jgi:methyl-accepting chemotaxis protein
MKLSISKLSLIASVVIVAGYIASLIVANYGLRELKVGGPVYERVVSIKDVIADILPPPAYVLEAYLEATLAYQDPKSVAAHQARLVQLRKDYDTRKEFWSEQAIDQTLKKLITQDSDRQAAKFWTAVETELLPAVQRGDTERAKVAYAAVTEAYNAHRAVIDQAVERSNKIYSDTEKFAGERGDTLTTIIWVVSGAVLIIILASAYGIIGGLVKPVGQMTQGMQWLASGNLDTFIPGTDRQDEIGEMAAALTVFKDNLIQTKRMQVEQVERDKRGSEERQQGRRALADEFQQKVGSVISSLSSAATQLQSSASSMSAIAQETSSQATLVSSSANQATGNVQTVAAAAEELSASISEIRRQVAGAADTAKRGVHHAESTNTTIQGLVEATSKISDVVELITSIASQTNLLALNATIEAARAGEAGKGFAVVASEVKSLANQTAKATEEISRYISSIQTATKDSVAALREIADIIGQIDSAAATINHSVEEQSNATMEISRSVQQAAASTAEVSQTITTVNEASGETGHAAGQVLEAAKRMSSESELLNREVQTFLSHIRG